MEKNFYFTGFIIHLNGGLIELVKAKPDATNISIWCRMLLPYFYNALNTFIKFCIFTVLQSQVCITES